MNFFCSILLIVTIALCIIFTFWACVKIFTRFMEDHLIQYRRETAFSSASDIIEAIQVIANLEFRLYEENRFREAGPLLSTSTFHNYFEELSKIIVGDLSPEFYSRAQIYMSDSAIMNVVAEMVRNYLTTKLAIVNGEEEEEPSV